MKRNVPGPSQLWKHINETQITKKSLWDLKNFKSDTINYKISLFNPYSNGVRYLKTLIYNLSADIESESWGKLLKIKNRDFGNPMTITYNNEKICLDYLQALYEIEFIEKKFHFKNSSILEIGAGYGRTCHAILSNYDVKTYCILDLENCLLLTQQYLKSVLNKECYSKICFYTVDQIDLLKKSNFDLTINIDSFSEMDDGVVKYYLDFIDKRSAYFYNKNPLGKYSDISLDMHKQGDKVVQFALDTGIIKDVIDIHNNMKVVASAKKFVKIYKPSKNWQCIANSWAKPFSYYWQAFYKNI